MRSLALPGGARVPVDPAAWDDALGVVTSGRVQLERRDGEPGPLLLCGATFWLRGTGVRTLRNPDSTTATVLVVTPRAPTSPDPSTLARADRPRRHP